MKEDKTRVSFNGREEEHPIAMMVQIASRYDSKVYVSDGMRKVNAKSIMGMMALGINDANSIFITAEGPDETEAVKALKDYVSGKAC